MNFLNNVDENYNSKKFVGIHKWIKHVVAKPTKTIKKKKINITKNSYS